MTYAAERRTEASEGLEALEVRQPPPARRALFVFGCVALLAIASASAGRALGTPFPSLWLDAYGDYSMVSLPSWDTASVNLDPLATLLTIDGVPVDHRRSGREVPKELQKTLEQAQAQGRTGVVLGFDSDTGERPYSLAIREVGATELGWYFALYALLGVSFITSGVLVWSVARRRSGAGAYFFLSCSTFVFLTTFFDYHTTRWLTPLFNAATFGNITALVVLALTFPTPLWTGPRARRLGYAALAVAGLMAAYVTVGPWLELPTRPLRQVVSVAMPVALLLLPISVVLRLRRAEGRDVLQLRAVLLGFLVMPAVLLAAYGAALIVGLSALHLVLPFSGLIVPTSVGFALVRHNILGMSAVLSRNLVAAPILFFALTVGALAALASIALSDPGQSPVLALAFGALVALTLFQPSWRFVERRFFPASARFRSSMERLSNELKARRDPEALRAHVARIVRSLLGDVEVSVLNAGELREECARLSLPDELIATRGHLFSGDDPFQRTLLVPLRSGGEVWGGLLVMPRTSGAPFSEDEIAFLEVMASLGAIALHNAEVTREVEERQEIAASASREDRRLAVDILAAEIAHEVAYPLNYFRHLLRQLSSGAKLDGEDIEIGAEEVLRLERMLASLRKLQIPSPALSNLALRTVVDRAIAVVAADPQARATIQVSIPEGCRVRADPDSLLQVFANLLRNARQATGPQGTVGVRVHEEASVTVIEVWDDGPGFQQGEIDRIFRAWYSNRSDGTGLGLAVTYRLVRAFGWQLSAERREGRTVFSIRTQATVKEGVAA